MRVAINLLTDDPANPTGAHWGWTRVIPEMAKLLTEDEEFRVLVSPKSRPIHQGYGPKVNYITFPWSNEKPRMRTRPTISTLRFGYRCRGSTSLTRSIRQLSARHLGSWCTSRPCTRTPSPNR